MTDKPQHYSVSGIEEKIISALTKAGLYTGQTLSPTQLAGLDHFHTGGYNASLILQDLAMISSNDRVLDIGAGLAGPARMLAAAPGCYVDCIELSEDYCLGAELLNRLTGLQDIVKVFRASATDMPFHDNSYDVVWMQNVGMNIKDKQRLYSEIARVLKPGGRFAFQEMTLGNSDSLDYPLPWASDATENFLLTATEMQTMLEEIGFMATYFEDVSDSRLNVVGNTTVNNMPAAELSLSTFVDDLETKANNASRNLSEAKIRFYRGVFISK